MPDLTVPARLLVVASPTSSPLSTPSPVPTDGQPEWSKCPVTRIVGHERNQEEPCRACVPDGPFPFTVGRWEEVRLCMPCGEYPGSDHLTGIECDGYVEPKVGAVVELAEVIGPSHHADQCSVVLPVWRPGAASPVRRCHPDAAPDYWHTPVGTVTRLDQPIPVERPVIRHTTLDPRCFTRPDQFPPGTLAPNPPETSPSSWWTDIDQEAVR